MRELTDTLPVAVYTTDVAGRITHFNASTPIFLVSATATRPSVMVEVNTPGTRTAMASARSTPSRASGRFCDPGASRYLAGEAAALSRLLPVRSQCSQTRKGFARLL